MTYSNDTRSNEKRGFHFSVCRMYILQSVEKNLKKKLIFLEKKKIYRYLQCIPIFLFFLFLKLFIWFIFINIETAL